MSDRDDSKRTHRVDLHQVSLEGDDQFHVKFVGDTTLQHAIEITDWIVHNLKNVRGAYLICDLRSAGSLDAATRRFVADWVSRYELSGIANYGAGLLTRTFSKLAISAMRALRQQPVENHFFSSEAESRAWVAGHRQRRAKT